MTVIIILLILILVAVLAHREPSIRCDIETETVYEETEEPLNIVGGLKRQTEGTQFFVLDPVDGQKIWLNSNDDMYEDADGKVWRLV